MTRVWRILFFFHNALRHTSLIKYTCDLCAVNTSVFSTHRRRSFYSVSIVVYSRKLFKNAHRPKKTHLIPFSSMHSSTTQSIPRRYGRQDLYAFLLFYALRSVVLCVLRYTSGWCTYTVRDAKTAALLL